MLLRPQYLGHPAAHLQSQELGEATRATHRAIVETLSRMLRIEADSPLNQSFLDLHHTLLRHIDTFQHQVLRDESREPSCAKGCAACCMHWVEDVNSFEGEILADHLRRSLPERIPGILTQGQEDIGVIENLDEEVHEAMRRSRKERTQSGAEFDHVDLLLASFYRLRRPCPLLAADGGCMVYALRPLTCRVYVSFSHPAHCDPDYAEDHDIPTVLLDLEEEANDLLDELHVRYDRFDNDTSLRSLLVRLLNAG
jgi:Fe-S-cluster containining protein